jgi:hypothetical protein
VDARGLYALCPTCPHREFWERPTTMEDDVTVIRGTPPPEPAPEGVWRAVCVDEYLLEKQETKFGIKDIQVLVWEIEELNPKAENRPYLVFGRFNATLGKGSKLLDLIEKWRGQKFGKEALDPKTGVLEFDTKVLVGVPCQLQIIHNTTDSATWANIAGIMPHKGPDKLKPSGSYTRKKDRDDASAGAEPTGVDDDIPF